MAPRKIGKRWFADFRHARVRYRKPSPLNTKTGATEYETILRLRLAKGEPLESVAVTPPSTFAKFSCEWFTTYVLTNNKLSEQQTKKVILRRHLVPAFGTLPLNAIGAEAVEAYKAEKLAVGLHPKTINNHLLVLKKCLRTALEWDRLARLPVIRALTDVPEPKIDYLLPEESCRLVADRTEPLWTDMALVGLRTGLRRGELLALQKGDANMTTRVLTVSRSFVQGAFGTTKSKKIRHLPMTSDVWDVFARAPNTGYVFGRADDRPHSSDVAEKAIHRLCDRARIRHVGWHALRHTFACELVMLNIPLPEVKDLLGHSSIVTTMRYIHFAPRVMRSAIDILEDAHCSGGPITFGQPAGKVPERQPLQPRVLTSIPVVNHH
ncbi:MAG: tyrosine-type recombinase/integrase [Patescibacteria group bacterium]